MDDYDIGWSIKHGDTRSMIKMLAYLRDVDRDLLLDKGRHAKKVIGAAQGSVVDTGRCPEADRERVGALEGVLKSANCGILRG